MGILEFNSRNTCLAESKFALSHTKQNDQEQCPWSQYNLERVTGIEPASSAWKAEVLPMNYTRKNGRDDRIRTCDILLPKQARYQTAPHPERNG